MCKSLDQTIKTIDRAKIVLLAIVVLWVIFQILCLIIYWNIEQSFDSDYYIEQAQLHVKIGLPYPTVDNLYDTYIQSPGYINFLSIILYLTNGYKTMLLLGLLMNIGILIDIFILAKLFYGRYTAYLAVLFYCIIPTNIFVPIWLVTELPYLFFGLTSFVLSLRHNPSWVIVAGIGLAFTQTIRPIAVTFLLCSLVYYILNHCRIRKYIELVIPYVLLLTLCGIYSKSTTGVFVTSSTVAGYDLMYTSYDDADGGQNPWFVFGEGGPGYIDNSETLNFAEKESIWKDRSLDWIIEHPCQYLCLCIRRIFLMYKSDMWTIPHLMEGSYNNTLVKVLINFPYYFILGLAVMAIFFCRGEWLSEKGLIIFYIIVGTGASCLFGMEVRYHYPFVFALVILAAYVVANRTRLLSSL